MSSVLPDNLANDPARNALMTNIRGSGGKRGLKPVSRREKKHSNFMDVLRKVPNVHVPFLSERSLVL